MNELIPPYLLIIAISYLLGAIPSAYIVGRMRNVNIFEVGSGNMGATNVIRATGKIYWGLLVWFADSLKAMAAIGIATRILPNEGVTPAVVSAIAAIIGHNWSIFAAMLTGTLRGGKGAAAAFGTIIVIAPFQVIAGMVAIGGLALVLTRYVSLAVLLMFGLALVWLLILVNQQVLTIEYRTYALAITALILVRFRENITRIINGTERRLGERV